MPGDMIELLAGHYYVSKNPYYGTVARIAGDTILPGGGDTLPPDLSSGAETIPREFRPIANSLIYGKNGTLDKWITICGSQGTEETILDGSTTNSTGGQDFMMQVIRMQLSSYVRLAGFTIVNGRRGLDIQKSSFNEFKYITTRNTLAEGIRLRYNATNNLISQSTITYTGRAWSGWGEGIYVGTSPLNSVDYGLPPDHTNDNTIQNNVFGPGVLAENIDIKEYTSGGLVRGNVFDGKDIRGINGGKSWIAMKGTSWTAISNIGYGLDLGSVGSGFRVLKQSAENGEYNSVIKNTCYNMGVGSYCVYVDPQALYTYVSCDNQMLMDASKLTPEEIANFVPGEVCNCQISNCSATPTARVASLLDSNITTTSVSNSFSNLVSLNKVKGVKKEVDDDLHRFGEWP